MAFNVIAPWLQVIGKTVKYTIAFTFTSHIKFTSDPPTTSPVAPLTAAAVSKFIDCRKLYGLDGETVAPKFGKTALAPEAEAGVFPIEPAIFKVVVAVPEVPNCNTIFLKSE